MSGCQDVPDGARVHIVDDDPAIRDSLAWLFRSRGVRPCLWESGEAFLQGRPEPALSCAVLDMRMEGISGLETMERMRAVGFDIPVIFLTGHADVPLAVEALKRGAVDFVEKPFNDNALVDTVVAAIRVAEAARSATRGRAELGQRLESLTARERQVLDLMLDGRLNKQIADDLGVSMRTIEVHRSRVLEKMGARNAVELAAALAGISSR
jgi:two-component system response regulator DctR